MLDKYEVLRQVGEGGMATVYLGRHTTLGREVAIKVLHPHLSASERNRVRFAREARAIEHLDHEHVLRIYDYSGTETQDCYIVTEFVDGVTLQQLIAQTRRIPGEVVTLIALELADALGYAHDLSIIHRDLKPENVMVRRDGVVKLMDFGIARFLDEVNLTVTGALVGTAAYMSPEQALERVLDSRSDLFSLGTLLFHALTGQLPFSGNNPSIVLRNVIEGNRADVLDLAPDVSGTLAGLVDRLLATEPTERPESCSEVRAELLSALAEVNLDPKAPEWSIRSWVIDPEGYEERLREHLHGVLLESGTRCLEDNDHLGALRQFNRLLAIDEQNPEVLALVQSMHRDSPSQGNRLWWLAAVGGVGVAGLLTLALWPRPQVLPETSTPDSTLRAESAVVVEPPESPVEPTPEVPSPTPPPEAQPPSTAPPASTPPRAAAKAPRKPRANVPEAPPEAATPGTVSVLVDGAWAWISIDGDRVGKTGQIGRIELTPGRHTLQVENDYSLPWERTFEVSPGEHRPFEITLKPRPATLVIAGSGMEDCSAALNGSNRGPLRDVSSRLLVTNPRQPHTLQVSCPNGTVHSKKLAPLVPGKAVTVVLP
ncbi:MAG: serine/threonine protein kinase [Deltaproteobacteria bacterium]|nr:serine/threonine protein kinase [Deltaproteobacteria bacterium]